MYSQISSFFLSAVNRLLAFFYSLPVIGGSYGLAIIMLTLFVMVVLMPLTLRATRSTIKMSQMQPRLRELQKKYKDDKPTLQQEMMKLYQEEGINPVGGCLPMVAQMPVFLLLFNVLRGLTRRINEKAYFTVADRAHELMGYEPTVGDTFDPANLDHTTKLYKDLSEDTEMKFLGIFDLARTASSVFSENIVASIPYLILIAAVVASSYYQQRQIQSRRGDQEQDMTQQQKTQQQLLKILPLMSGVWSFAFPAGLVLYWMTSNLFRIGQQSYITRSLYSGEGEGAKLIAQQAEEAKAKKEAKDNKAAEPDDSSNDASAPSKKSKQNNKKADLTDWADGEAVVSSNGTGSTGANGAAGRDRAADLAAQRAKARSRKARAEAKKTTSTTPEASSRVTPKGTPPSSNKNKRKKR